MHNTNLLPRDKALLAVEESKTRIEQVIKSQVEQYNKQHKFFAENTQSLNNTISQKEFDIKSW
ncbi:hypothetical protein GCM10022297_16170 [Lactobacillus hamsteri]